MAKELSLTRQSSGTHRQWRKCLQETREGNREAQARLLETVRPYLVQLAHGQLDSDLRPKMAASDVVQEVLLEAWEDLPEFRGTSRAEVVAWLQVLLKHQSVDATRRYRGAEKRSVDRELNFETVERAQGKLPAVDPSPSRQIMAHERQELVEQALRRLAADDERILRLRSQTELTFAEVGRILEISEEAARKRWTRATDRLASELQTDESKFNKPDPGSC
jgi:RNA polymerase sigma-70 factor (ECF subfamily)